MRMIVMIGAVLLACGPAAAQAQTTAAERAAVLQDAQRHLLESQAAMPGYEKALAEAYRAMFTREGATPLDFDRDKWACDRDLGLLGTRGSAVRRPTGGPLYIPDLEKCLALTGWQRAAK